MSKELPIVFARGQNESIDPRVLPVDQHKTVKNVRFRKDGRPQKRPGLVNKTTAGTANSRFVNGITEYAGRPVLASGGSLQVAIPGATTWTAYGPLLSQWGPGERFPIYRQDVRFQDQPAYVTSAWTGRAVVHAMADVSQFILTQTWSLGGEIIFLPSYSMVGDYPRLLTVNGNTYIFYSSTAIGVAGSLNVRLYNAATGGFGAATTLQTITGGGAFDVCAHGTTEFLLTWQNSLTTVQVARYSAALTPIIVGSAKSLTANSSAVFPSVSCTSTSSIWVAWLEQTATPSVQFAVFDSTLTTQTGATAIVQTAAGIFDQPGLCVTSNTSATVCYGKFVSPDSTLFFADLSSVGVITNANSLVGARISSKPFNGLDSGAAVQDIKYLWAHSPELDAWEDQRATYLLKIANTSGATNRSLRQLHVPGALGSETVTAGVPKGNLHLNDVIDTGSGFEMASRVQLRGYSTGNPAQNFGVDSVVFHSIYESQFYAARDFVLAGRALQISGGCLAEHVGATQETGFSSQPVFTAAVSAGGAMSVGTYLYRVVYEHLDLQGRRCRSSTSDPVSVTTAGGNLSATLLITPMCALGKAFFQSGTNVSAHVYRSLVGQSTYHRVTPNIGAAPVSPGAVVAYSDAMSDNNAAGQEFIYTDGGVLDNALPPPSTFMCLCNGRLWLGGQFDRTVITASKLLIDGEPTQFSSFAPFNVTLPRKCTGLASIDGTVVAFASDAIYLVTGDGPNSQGVGSFNPPSALPTNGGCIDWRSVVETSIGVFFQSQRGIMLLPRGFNTPEFIGAPIEDTLRTYPLITSATLVCPTNGDETTVRFTVNDGGGVNPGATLVYNIRTGGWIVDTIQTGEIVGPGGTWLGQWVQTSATSTNVLANLYEEPVTAAYAEGAGNAFVPSILATGDLRPFGVAGYGNFETVTVMGEYRGNANVIVSVSVDGVTADTFTFAVTSADAADGVVYLDVTPKIRKGCSISITIQDAAIGGVATEGFIAQAVYLEVDAMPGNKRLAAARRA